MGQTPEILAAAQPRGLEVLKNKLAAGLLALGVLATGGAAERAEATPAGQALISIDPSVGDSVGLRPHSLSSEYATDGSYVGGFSTEGNGGDSDVRGLFCDSQFTNCNVKMIKELGATGGTISEVVVPEDSNPIFFYNTNSGAKRADCSDSGCSSLVETPFLPNGQRIAAINAEPRPGGGFGVAFTEAGNKGDVLTRVYKPNLVDYVSSKIRPFPDAQGRTDRRIANSPKIGFGDTNQVRVAHRIGVDTIITTCEIDCNPATGDAPLSTAIDPQSSSKRSLALDVMSDGYRAAFQANRVDETGGGEVTRIGYHTTSNDEEGYSTTTTSAEVIDPNSGNAIGIQASIDESSLVIIQGDESGASLAECVNDAEQQGTPNCSTSYQMPIVQSGPVKELAYKVDDIDGDASLLFTNGSGTDTELWLQVGPNATLGFDPQTQGQQQQSTPSGSRNSASNHQETNAKTPLPSPNAIHVAIDYRETVGRLVIDRCIEATGNFEICDRIWHPVQP